MARGWSRFLDDGERARRIRLGGLDEHEVRALLGSLVSTPLTRGAVARLREHTDGHPRHIRALVDELPAHSLNAEHGPLPAPHLFAATVLARLATLSPAAPTRCGPAALWLRRRLHRAAARRRDLDGTLAPLLDEVLSGRRAGARRWAAAGGDPVRPSAHARGRVRRSLAEPAS